MNAAMIAKRNPPFRLMTGKQGLAAIAILLVAFVTRISTFGDPNLHVDEEFYFLVGQRMHDGLLPYVDIWDRKPFGLFAIYYLIAALSREPLAYQIVATLFAALTAGCICLAALTFTRFQGALLAALAYLFVLGTFGGFGGQAPVFYNLFIAAAATLILHRLDDLEHRRIGWQVHAAMVIAGLAITVKQTSLFEASFFGMAVLLALHRAGETRPRLLCLFVILALEGAAPTLAISIFYAASGHWHEYWHAMVTANLTKPPMDLPMLEQTVSSMAVRIFCIAGLALWSVRRWSSHLPAKRFVAGWLGAALLGLLAVPRFHLHYALPLMVPLSLASAGIFASQRQGRIAFMVFLVFYNAWYDISDRSVSRASIAGMNAMAAAIRREDPAGTLFIFDDPSYLYAMTDKRLLTPLAFPSHFNHLPERNVSHIDTDREINRVLAMRPDAIITSASIRNVPVNTYARERVIAYVRTNCRKTDTVPIPDGEVKATIELWAHCNSGRRQTGNPVPAPAVTE